MDFSVTHRGHGGEGHVEGVKRLPVLNGGEPRRSDQQRRHDSQNDKQKTAREPVHRIVSTKYSGKGASVTPARLVSTPLQLGMPGPGIRNNGPLRRRRSLG